ncbi:hypothetical protein BGZ97_011548, partial [Linnemannia gamsii]
MTYSPSSAATQDTDNSNNNNNNYNNAYNKNTPLTNLVTTNANTDVKDSIESIDVSQEEPDQLMINEGAVLPPPLSTQTDITAAANTLAALFNELINTAKAARHPLQN